MQESVIKAFADKVPKVVIAAVDIVTTALRSVIVILAYSMPGQCCQANLHGVLTAVFMQPLWCEGCVPSASSKITSQAV